MSIWLTFSPAFSPIVIGLLLLALAAVDGFFEATRVTRFRTLRLITLGAGLLALAGIFFKPAYRSATTSVSALVTENFLVNHIDSLRKVYPKIEFFNMPGVESTDGSKTLSTVHEISSIKNQVKFVLGAGLPQHALELLDKGSFQFVSSAKQSGIVQIHCDGPLMVNQKTNITGVFRAGSDTTKITLSAGGVPKDSTILTGNGDRTFSLSYTPQQAGKFLLNVTTSQHSKSEEQLFPVVVTGRQILRILILQKYPSFETQYLKRYLGKDHQVTLRYQLSKNTFRYEYINRSEKKIVRITEKFLSDFDLVFIDTDALSGLGSTELINLKKALSTGLGLVVLFNEPPEKLANLKSFIPEFRKIESDTAHITADKHYELPAWNVALKNNSSVSPVTVNKNRILSGYQYAGLGKVGFQLLQETYRLSLQGDSIGYSMIWAPLIGKVARSKDKVFDVSIQNKFPLFTDEPVVVKIISSGPEPVLLKDKIEIPLAEDALIDDVWYGKFWADEPGWHELTIAGDSSVVDYYVSEKGSWNSLVRMNTEIQTQIWSADTQQFQNTEVQILRPVPQWIFYLIFLLCFGFLWIAPKL
jgi:hypothetical protein